MPEDDLFRQAERYAIRSNGRSPRTAKQFVQLLKIEAVEPEIPEAPEIPGDGAPYEEDW